MSWSSVCLPWRNVYLDLLPIFWLGFIFSCMSLIVKHSRVRGLQSSIITLLLKWSQLWSLRGFHVSPSFLDLFLTHWNFSIIQAHILSVPAFRVTIVYGALISFTGEWHLERKMWVLGCARYYWGVSCSRAWVCMHIRIVTNANVFISLYLCVCILSLYWNWWFPSNKH